jgi:hypothetical protein
MVSSGVRATRRNIPEDTILQHQHMFDLTETMTSVTPQTWISWLRMGINYNKKDFTVSNLCEVTSNNVLQWNTCCIHLFVLLQGFCVSCLFCFANMDVHYAMLPLLKQLFGSRFEGENAITVQRANTLTHSTRDLCVWPRFKMHRGRISQNTRIWCSDKPYVSIELCAVRLQRSTRNTVTALYCAVCVLITATQLEPVPYCHQFSHVPFSSFKLHLVSIQDLSAGCWPNTDILQNMSGITKRILFNDIHLYWWHVIVMLCAHA